MPKIDIKLLGRPSLTVDGNVQAMPEKAFVLLAILTGSRIEPVTRSRLRAILWGETDREKANANLRQLIARIRKVEQQYAVSLLDLRDETVALNATLAATDYGACLATLQDAGVGDFGARCETLLRLWSGPLLDGCSFDEAPVNEWLDQSRERLRHGFVDAARSALDMATDPAAADAAWALALKVIDIDPTEEVAYRAMMRICVARGDRGLALRIFGRVKRVLGSELGVQPGAQTQDLANLLRRREPASAGLRGLSRPVKLDSVRQIPAIMVVPPLDLVTDAETRQLALGFIEDITLGLMRFRHFSVIAPHSGAAVTFGSRSLAEALQVLDVDYAVTTALIPGALGSRLTVRLTDMSSAEALWATDTDFTLAKLGDAFEQAVGSVVRTLIETIDARQMRTPIPANDATAYHHYLEGRRLMSGSNLPAIRRARRVFRRALDEVADYPAALAGVSRTFVEERLVRGMAEDDLLLESLALANRAAALDPFDGRAFKQVGHANLYLRRHDESLAAFGEALRLNPHDADILADYADALCHSGDPIRALELCRKAFELNPNPPESYVWILGSIYYQLGEYRMALESLEPMECRDALSVLLAAAAGQLGERELVSRHGRVVRRVYPDFDLELTGARTPDRNPIDTEHMVDGLKRAGLG